MIARSTPTMLLANALVFALASTVAGAQAPTTTSVKPAIAPSAAQTVARPALSAPSSTSSSTSSSASVMAAGPYKLGLHAQKKNNQAVTMSDFISTTSVTRSGNGITITASDGLAVSGTVSGTQLHASGTTSSGGTIALTGTTSNGGASGTFTAHDGSNTLTGIFSLAPGIYMGPTTTQRKLQNYGDPKPSSDPAPACGFWCQLKQWFGL